MWQLKLLSRVIPVFGALAKEFIEDDNPDTNLSADAHDYYSDIVNIGYILSISRGEWASGVRDEVVTRLLAALNTRLPSQWTFFSVVTLSPASAMEQGEAEQFPALNELYNLTELRGLGGFDECLELPGQPSERRRQYVELVGRGVSLFHKTERQSNKKRDKFLHRVKEASKHLLDVYCRDRSGTDAGEEFGLSQHPSHGIKDLADRVYSLLERHWKCHCAQRAARPSGAREARLSLIRHRQLAPKLPLPEIRAQSHHPAKFDVPLPICKGSVEWKVTNVEVKQTW